MHRSVEKHYRVEEAAKALGLSSITLRRWAVAGKLYPARRYGDGVVLIPQSALDRVRRKEARLIERKAWRRAFMAPLDVLKHGGNDEH